MQDFNFHLRQANIRFEVSVDLDANYNNKKIKKNMLLTYMTMM